jgi:hypothetical protein
MYYYFTLMDGHGIFVLSTERGIAPLPLALVSFRREFPGAIAQWLR